MIIQNLLGPGIREFPVPGTEIDSFRIRVRTRSVKNGDASFAKASQRGLRTPLQPGAVTLIQRFGGSLNLNVHYHMLFLEVGFIETERGPRLWWVSPPSDEEIKEIVIRIASRVIRFLKKRGYYRDEADAVSERGDVREIGLILCE